MDGEARGRLDRFDRRQEAVVQAVSTLADTMQVMSATLEEIAEWLKKPPSSDLPDALKALTTQIRDMREEISKLPERVARTVSTGEI